MRGLSASCPLAWGPSSRLPQRLGRPPPERSSTLTLVHPSGTAATSACSSVLSLSSFLFFISRRSQTLICHLYFTKTHPVCTHLCVCGVCVYACVRVFHAAEKTADVHCPGAPKVGVTQGGPSGCFSHWEQRGRPQDVSGSLSFRGGWAGLHRTQTGGRLLPGQYGPRLLSCHGLS